ncbi:MAG: hypothetical protein M0R75_12070 [Dehalococcoidia bacterium]|nr:hypothetical protein [Dehalococcoidia bacterium]
MKAGRLIHAILPAALASSFVLIAMAYPAGAQTPTTAPETTSPPDTTFRIQLVDLVPGDPIALSHRTNRGRIVAVVDGVVCASVDARTSPPGQLVLGLPDQADECARAGASVALFDESGGELWIHPVVQPGAVVEFGNYATGRPVDTGAPIPATAGYGSAADGQEPVLPMVLLIVAVGGLVTAARRVSRRSSMT